MFKTMLDHRFAEEFETLRKDRNALAELLASTCCAPASRRTTFIFLKGGMLSPNSDHPLWSNRLILPEAHYVNSNLHLDDLTNAARLDLTKYVDKVTDHVRVRSEAKRLMDELEKAVHYEAVQKAWPESKRHFTPRPLYIIRAELNQVLLP